MLQVKVGYSKLARRTLSPHISGMLPDEQASPEQLAALRAMTGEQKLRVAEQMFWSARKLKAAGVRSFYPDWTEEQVEEEVRRIFLHART